MKSLIALALLVSMPVLAKVQITDVAIENVFIPSKGYDSNDNIEVVIDGKLPNACFEIYQSEIKIDQTNFLITVRQLMKVKDITECEPTHQDHQNIPMWPIQYTNVLTVGNLKAGSYKIKYTNGTDFVYKDFEVSSPATTSMDDHIYAPISNAFIPELIYATENAEVILTGIITNTCMNFNGDVEVKKVDNVFIILPKMDITHFNNCLHIQEPLQSIVSLGPIKKEGRYLIHVRSTTGQSVNKVFSVKESPIDINGNHL